MSLEQEEGPEEGDATEKSLKVIEKALKEVDNIVKSMSSSSRRENQRRCRSNNHMIIKARTRNVLLLQRYKIYRLILCALI